MEKLNFVKDGVIKLPPGFRFQPTDEELVFQYLKSKVFSCPLPASIIPDINVYKYDPWDLPGDLEQEKYFFCNKEAKYRNGNRINMATNSGHWKATGLDKKIITSRRNQIMGMKKTLVFHRGKLPHMSKTDWAMHEFRLVSAETAACTFPLIKNSINQKSRIQQKEDWVICCVFKTKRSITKDYASIQTCTDYTVKNTEVSEPKFAVKFMIDPSLSSSGCSGITDAFSRESDDEESSDDDECVVSSLDCLRGREI